MRTTEAARYARWSAAAAILLAVIVAGVFARRSWQARQARKDAPPVVPPTVQQRSAGFSFSKVEQDRTLFTVRASRATEFKEGNRNLLEDVWIIIYGRSGERFDNIHTQACDYMSDSGRIVCAGEVHLDLESAEEARQHGGQSPDVNTSGRVIHVATRNVSFDRETGEARSEQPVEFRFPGGQGRGVGVTYSSRDAVVRLHRDVELTIAQPPGGPAAHRVPAVQRLPLEPGHPPEPLILTGSSLELRRGARTARLTSPVHARQGPRELLAGELVLELDADLRAHRLVARAESARAERRPELRSTGPRGQAVLTADEFVAFLHPEGWMERFLATGHVRGNMSRASEEDRFEAERVEMEMSPRLNQPHVVNAGGGVTLQSSDGLSGSESRRLETPALRFFFAKQGKAGAFLLDRAETLAPATLELQSPDRSGGKTATVSTRLRGQQLAAEFGERNQLRSLTGHDGVATERRLPGRPPQVTSSREFVAQFDPRGEWTIVEQSGNVHAEEAATGRSAAAEHARLERSSDTITLTGAAVLADALTRTSAQSVVLNQRTGETRAEGDVRTSYLSAGRNAATNLAPQPAHISSDRLLANSSSGRAVYSGRARLWQGDAVIEADSIELQRETQRLDALGNVFAVFPQAASSPRAPAPPGKAATNEPGLWRVRAGVLSYWSAEARARLEQNVSAQSSQAQINSRVLELFFSSSGPRGGAVNTEGAQQLSRAVATGGVTVQQGDRRGTAERAEYTAADGKFVLSGGRPTLYDAFRGTTTGRQLTFYFADDRIVVDSEEGSRTLTRHQVEK